MSIIVHYRGERHLNDIGQLDKATATAFINNQRLKKDDV
jgi:hypothetical protein